MPSTVTVRSAIASSSADCVLGVARLISSARKTLAKTGPGRKTNAPVLRSRTGEPVMSAGSRSGVHWMRLVLADIVVLMARASTVLPVPG